jgi:hypothetical protein
VANRQRRCVYSEQEVREERWAEARCVRNNPVAKHAQLKLWKGKRGEDMVGDEHKSKGQII